jgi:hypothetical protein
LPQHARQTLLGDAKNIEQIRNRHAGPEIDEVDHPVMRTPESLHVEQRVGVADEVAIGEEKQPHHVDGHLREIVDRRIYVSYVDIY